MLGSLLDRIFVAYSNRNGSLPLQIEHHSFRNGDVTSNWVCFIPEFCYRIPSIRKRIIPEGINLDVYVLPKTIIQPNPELTRVFLDDVLRVATQNQTKHYSRKEVNVLGISLGNVLSFRFAEQFPVNNLLSVVPGSRLAECIWESIATNPITENSGRSLQDYQKSLANYNPIESVSRINPSVSEIYLGGRDLMIPSKRGKELAQAMQEKVKVNIKYHRFSGHVETVVSFSKKFHKIVHNSVSS